MPPIMGAAAFVMAEFQGVSYAQIVIWATIPAILYYVACFAAVHFEAKRQGLLGVPRSELPRARQDVMASAGTCSSRSARSCSSCIRAIARRWQRWLGALGRASRSRLLRKIDARWASR